MSGYNCVNKYIILIWICKLKHTVIVMQKFYIFYNLLPVKEVIDGRLTHYNGKYVIWCPKSVNSAQIRSDLYFFLFPIGMTRRAIPWTDSLWRRWKVAAGEETPTGRLYPMLRLNTWDTETRYPHAEILPWLKPSRYGNFRHIVFHGWLWRYSRTNWKNCVES